MNIGFYSPLKSPQHPTPSGDREMARSLVSVLETLGHSVTPLCQLRSFDRNGEQERQLRIKRLGRRSAEKIMLRNLPLDLVFTYHAYHKAPDWIGPHLKANRGVPYVIAEASIAGKQSGGLWHIGHEATIAAVQSADHVFAMTEIDSEALVKHVKGSERLSLLRPFTTIPAQFSGKPKTGLGPPRLLCVAMMRDDVKLRSYRFLAEALELVEDIPWTLDVIGDGPARAAVRNAFSAFGNRIHFHGKADRDNLSIRYQNADIFVWPGIREAYGLVYLEAQAYGLPVVAIANGGVAEVVKDGETGLLSPVIDPVKFAAQLSKLLRRKSLRNAMAVNARDHVRRNHSAERAMSVIERAFARLNVS